jgi:2-oxoisovalerate dehydrogenase E1 component
MSSAYGPRVQTTPISEAAITGVGIGLALCGRRAFVEIMFGDFITYAFDQIVNNASKIFHMYNQMLDCPVIIRTPMGGRRGYGPTHSQSLERFLIGIDNCCAISLNSLVPVEMQIVGIEKMRCPVLLIENKSDYTVRTFVPADVFVVKSDGGLLPTLRVHTENAQSTLTVLAYGGMARFIANSLIEIFERTDVVPELIVPVGLSPINLNPIAESLSCTGRLLVVEEGPSYGSVGGETIAQLHERPGLSFVAARVGGKATPIPSAPSLEAAALPSVDEICAAISALMERA